MLTALVTLVLIGLMAYTVWGVFYSIDIIAGGADFRWYSILAFIPTLCLLILVLLMTVGLANDIVTAIWA